MFLPGESQGQGSLVGCCLWGHAESDKTEATAAAAGLPVHHELPEFTQTHVHRVGDAIQPFILHHPLLLLPPIPPSIKVFSNESTLLMRWPKFWSFSFSISLSNEHSGLISFRMDWLDLLAVQGTLKSVRPTPQFKSINSSAFSFPYSPTLTFIQDHWKNYSLD